MPGPRPYDLQSDKGYIVLGVTSFHVWVCIDLGVYIRQSNSSRSEEGNKLLREH